ncbi:MAG: hypothetical protein V2I33_04550, partial [Kangiellaceae bacterium]|nr:hypothetical protein [Kangiellaceae bacterium]
MRKFIPATLLLSLTLSYQAVSSSLNEADSFTQNPSISLFNDLPIGGGSGVASMEVDVFPEHIKRQEVEQRLAAHSDNLLGDSLDINTGSVVFTHTDVAIPGNSSLEVAIRRKRTGGFKYPHIDEASRAAFDASGLVAKNSSQAFGDWELDVPHISQLIPVQLSGSELLPVGIDAERVSFCGPSIYDMILPYPWGVSGMGPGTVFILEDGNMVDHEDITNGVMMSVQGGEQKRLLDFPTGISWPTGTDKVTTDYWYAKCIENPSGVDGLQVYSPNGDIYTFDKVQYRHATAFPVTITGMAQDEPRKVFTSIPRIDVRLQVSRITDKNGNYVDYSYNSEGWLTSITSNDGRSIMVNYNGNYVSSISTNGRSWIYQYGTTSTGQKFLEKVTLPDDRQWTFNIATGPLEPNPGQDCTVPDVTWQLTHPDGITGTFLFRETKHAKAPFTKGVSPFCAPSAPALPHAFYDVMSLKTKTLVGPGYPSATWRFNYSGTSSTLTKWGEVIDPVGNRTRTTFHNKDNSLLEGLTKSVEVFSSTGTRLERKDFEYVVEADLGDSLMPNDNDAKLQQPRYQSRVTTTRGSDSYAAQITYNNSQSSSLYSYGKATQISRSSSVSAGSRSSVYTYDHLTSNKWILGLMRTESWNGTQINDYRYDSLGRMNRHYSIGGRLRAELTYNSDGTVNTVTNALGHQTTARDWYRGVPQTIERPDGLVMTQTVDANGWTTNITDFEGECTRYDYTDMGRLTLIDPCDTRWTDTVINYQTTSGNDGLNHVSSGMLKQSISRGRYRENIYYDAMLRPRMVRERDSMLPDTARFTRTDFDAIGRAVYTSLPSDSSLTPYGSNTSYDALGRTTLVDDNTTPGTVSYSYLSGNRVSVNDNKGNETTTTYEAWGQPSQDEVSLIQSPEGVTTSMVHNVFGNITAISQGGITEHRVYDGFQQLCKTVRPDVGNRAMGYNTMGQMTWMAAGSSVSGSTTLCDNSVSNSERVSFVYDVNGNVTNQNYGDASPDRSFTYDNNNKLTRLTAGSVINTYQYNSAGLLELEQLQVDGYNFTLDYTYNGLGHLTNTTYPSGQSVAYNPNGLGQPTTVGSYVSAALYHPNGLVKQHNYGNGFLHSVGINSSGLPDSMSDSISVTIGTSTDAQAGISGIGQTSSTFTTGMITLNESLLPGGGGSGETPPIIDPDMPTTSRVYAVDNEFNYDANNNLITLTDQRDARYSLALTYDGLDRLDNINDSYLGTGSVNYDTMGNITSYTVGSRALSYNYDSNKKLSSVSGYRNYSFSYDACGNVTSNGTRSFNYNLAGDMISSGSNNGSNNYLCSGSNNGSNNYLYSGDNKRVKTVDGNGTTYSMFGQNGKL